ncbi:hypothetical protein [Streptomyces pseudovenezuelae]|uniref:hypothetical protein n=1 Tax=Streptomyces pseudovenezuelae TaxID=67350 RepID=UPI0036EE98CB
MTGPPGPPSTRMTWGGSVSEAWSSCKWGASGRCACHQDGSGYEHASEPWEIPPYAGFHPLLEQFVHEATLTAQLTQFAATPWPNSAYVSVYAGEERLLFISEVWVQRILGGVMSRLQGPEGNSVINNKSV